MTPPPESRFWTVPNTLTVSRMGLGVVAFGLIAVERYVAALVVFSVAMITDALDGYLARLWNQTSAMGRQLDPLVDKVIITGGFIFLVALPTSLTGLAPWMVTVIVVRELLIQWLRSLLEGRGEAFGARGAGKLKTFLQSLAIGAILLVLGLAEPSAAWRMTRDVLIWAAVILTIYSGLAYFVVAWTRLRPEAPAPPP